MMTPTIHLNGTGRKSLLDELEVAHTALNQALVAVGQVTVHGRDYYPQGDHAYGQAREEMVDRLNAIRKVREDVIAMHIAIQQQSK